MLLNNGNGTRSAPRKPGRKKDFDFLRLSVKAAFKSEAEKESCRKKKQQLGRLRNAFQREGYINMGHILMRDTAELSRIDRIGPGGLAVLTDVFSKHGFALESLAGTARATPAFRQLHSLFSSEHYRIDTVNRIIDLHEEHCKSSRQRRLKAKPASHQENTTAYS